MTNGESAAVDIELELAAQLEQLRAENAAVLEQLRAENAALRDQLTVAPVPKDTPGRGRRVGSIICAVVGAILLPLAVITVWTRQSILDTNAYVETVAPLADNEDIQAAVTVRVTEAVAEVVDFRSIAEETLPPEAAVLAGPIESGAKSLIQDVVGRVVASDAFADLWEDVNRLGHENVVAVLTGEGNDTLDTEGGKVVVRVGPIAEEVLNNLDEILGTDLENSIPDDRLDGEFVLVESDDLANLQDEISLFDKWSWLIPILTIALLAASVVISRPRRLAVRRLGIAIVASMAISLLLYDWIRSQYIAALPDDTHNPDAAAAFYDITTRFIPRDMRVLLVFGVVILFLAWLFGPTGWAVRARAWWDTLVGRAGDAGEARDVGDAPRWIADNERTLLAFTFATGVLTLLVWTRPTGLVVLIVIIAVALVMAATSLVAEIGRRAESADEKRSESAAAGGESPDAPQLNETDSDKAPATNAPT